GAGDASHPPAAWPGIVPALVGPSGIAAARWPAVTPSARRVPALMCSTEPGRLSNMTWTRLLSRSCIAGAEPRYGTCCMLMPVIALNNSPDMCTDVPLPDEAMLILPGLALA